MLETHPLLYRTYPIITKSLGIFQEEDLYFQLNDQNQNQNNKFI